MNVLKDVYEESKQQQHDGPMNMREGQHDDHDDDEENSEYQVVLTEDNKRIINETSYYIKHVNILDEDIVIPFDDEE